MPDLYIGLMSGTSMDGIDAALVDITDNHIELLASHSHEIPRSLKNRLEKLILNSAEADIDILGETDTELGIVFADAVNQLLLQAGYRAEQITAIGSHGQTIRHRPDAQNPFSLQIADPNHISQLTGITTVADFRRRDMAAGGEGAPLAPAFHQQVFHSAQENRAVLNIGGIANISFLPAASKTPCIGFDCGPGNTLMDTWIRLNQGKAFDRDGEWAASHQADDSLLRQLMRDRFISAAPPKSTGREHYNLAWLQQQLADHGQLDAGCIQASLSRFSCESIAYGIEHHIAEIQTLIICGGGAHNRHLVQQLRERLAPIRVSSSEAFGIHPDWVEAIAFAWLASRTLAHLPGNLPAVTGANQETILGGIYPAAPH